MTALELCFDESVHTAQLAHLRGREHRGLAAAGRGRHGEEPIERGVEVALDLNDAGGTLTARGTFRLRQTEFGMVPFSVAGGAIQVADEIVLGFEIVATAR